MPAQTPISNSIIEESIVRAVSNVCQIMLQHSVEHVETTSDALLDTLGPQPHIVGSVGFAGEANGIVYLCLSESFAKEAATRILGFSMMEMAASDQAVLKDIVGEITNMTAGAFKNVLCDMGHPCKLTIPTVVLGKNLHVATVKYATRQVYHFVCNGSRLIADVQIRHEQT